MRTVRTTLFPDRPIQVDDAEYTDLSRQGLLLPEPPPPPAPEPPVISTPPADPDNQQENQKWQ